MAKSLLGDTIDVHMGGVEHISVHHTNEIAQSEAANEKPFVHYWLHNEHLNVNDAKMAKSQGTGFTLQEIINKNFDPLDLRYFYLSAHYRSKQNFTWEALSAAKETLTKLRAITQELKKSNETHKSNESHEPHSYYQRFRNALLSDFQIPQALAVTWEMFKSDLSPQQKLTLLFDFDKVFGLRLIEVTEEKIPNEAIMLAEERKLARFNKDFKKSDELRVKIEKLGFRIEDKNEAYIIKKL